MSTFNGTTPGPTSWQLEPQYCDLGNNMFTPVPGDIQHVNYEFQRFADVGSSTLALPTAHSWNDQQSTTQEQTSSATLGAHSNGVSATFAAYAPIPSPETEEPVSSGGSTPTADLRSLQTSDLFFAPRFRCKYADAEDETWTEYPSEVPAPDPETLCLPSPLQNNCSEESKCADHSWMPFVPQSLEASGPQAFSQNSHSSSGQMQNVQSHESSNQQSAPSTSTHQACANPHNVSQETRTIVPRPTRPSDLPNFVSLPRMGARSSIRASSSSQAATSPRWRSDYFEAPRFTGQTFTSLDLQTTHPYNYLGYPALAANSVAWHSSNGHAAAQSSHSSASVVYERQTTSSADSQSVSHSASATYTGGDSLLGDNSVHDSSSARYSQKQNGNSIVTPATNDFPSKTGSAGTALASVSTLPVHDCEPSSSIVRTTGSIHRQSAPNFAPRCEEQTFSANSPQGAHRFEPMGTSDQAQQGIRPPVVVCIVRRNAPTVNDSVAQSSIAAESAQEERIAARPDESHHTVVGSAPHSSGSRSSALRTLRKLLLNDDPFTISKSPAQDPCLTVSHAIRPHDPDPARPAGPATATSVPPAPQSVQDAGSSSKASSSEAPHRVVHVEAPKSVERTNEAVVQSSFPTADSTVAAPASGQSDPPSGVPQSASTELTSNPSLNETHN